VLEIFELRPKMSTGRQRRGSMIQCKSIAPKYGVTAKTVREIWRGLTWTETTFMERKFQIRTVFRVHLRFSWYKF